MDSLVPSGVDMLETDCRVYRDLSDAFDVVVHLLREADEGCGCGVSTDLRPDSVESVREDTGVDRRGALRCLG